MLGSIEANHMLCQCHMSFGRRALVHWAQPCGTFAALDWPRWLVVSAAVLHKLKQYDQDRSLGGLGTLDNLSLLPGYLELQFNQKLLLAYEYILKSTGFLLYCGH